MKAFSVSIAVFLICCLSPQYAYSQSDSCTSNFTAVNGFVFDTSSLNCDIVWTDQNYILRYKQASADVWSFVLSAPNTDSYVAMGFSPNGGMVGSSAMVGWAPSGGSAVVKQYYLGGQSPSQVIPDDGKLVLVGNGSILAVESNIYMGFQLNTSTTPGNRLIYSVGPSGYIPSSSNYLLTLHSNQVTTSINYLTGQTQTAKTPYSNLQKNHGILNMLGWGILLPIGAMVARYFKEWDPIWFYSHISIQSLGFILGVAGISCGFVLEHKLSVSFIVRHHRGLGIVILVLGCLQIMAVLARPNKESKHRKYWNWYHHTVGRLLILFAAVNIFYGIHLGKAGRGWDAGYGLVLIGLFIIAAALEVRMWMRK